MPRELNSGTPTADPRRTERGAALFVLLAVFLMAGVSLAIEALLIKSKRQRADQKAAIVLAEAKRALIAHAALDAGNRTQFGHLPCPFTGTPAQYATSALENTPCGAADDRMVIGFLPWQSLGLPPLYDGDGAPVWYAVAGTFKTGSDQTMPYTCTTSNLTLNGAGNHAAILIAPGDPLETQQRPPTSSAATLRTHYLEGRNATASTTSTTPPIDFENARIVLSSTDGTPFNDRLLTITCAEITGAVNQMPP
ncbi:MAG: hypothetical protein G8237_06230 [Magnetococcales bacterium]|nr:hypothetical protein [Magnetococcales bacterium]